MQIISDQTTLMFHEKKNKNKVYSSPNGTYICALKYLNLINITLKCKSISGNN